jgi:hypothetical protein
VIKIDVALGESVSCTLTNSDDPSYVTVTKIVNNDEGGLAEPDDFLLKLDGASVLSGIATKKLPGTYVIDETLLSGYTFDGISGDCYMDGDVIKIDVALGESVSCTLTNSDDPSYVTVTKIVNNDEGGTAAPNDFLLTLDGASVLSGVATKKLPGTYVIDETLLSGYTFDGVTGDCYMDGDVIKIDVALGESVSCTLKNSDIAPKLTLIKTVVGGTASPNDFLLTIGGLAATSGTTYEKMAGVAYSIDETDLEFYVFGEITGDPECPSDLGGTVTMDVGDDVTCTITNHYIDITIDKQIRGYDEVTGYSEWQDSLDDMFVFTDLYYRFIVTNTGEYDLKNVQVTDPILAGLLGEAETYVFCTYETLAVGETVTCGEFGPIEAGFNDSGSICNTASVEGTARPGTDYAETVTDSDEACYVPRYWAFTPGFWKNHYEEPRNAWKYTAYETTDLLTDVGFVLGDIGGESPKGLNKTFNELTLLEALRLKGGAGIVGAGEILLRAGVASLLNASFHEEFHGTVDPYFPMTSAEVITAVNTAIATGNPVLMLELAAELDGYNNGYEYFDWSWTVP